MKRKWLVWWIYLLGGLVACSDDKTETEPQASRTILVYMLANNSLDGYSDANVDAMIEGIRYGKNNGGNLLVYHAAKDIEDHTLFEIKDNQEHFVKAYDEHDPTDPAVMRQIIQDAVSLYPADSYGLILWSHGTAWLPSDYGLQLRAFGQDGTHWMEIDELAEGIPDHLFDFILFDACYMASVECAYELRDKAEYILASPTEVMGTGWPYDRVMPHLFASDPQYDKACEAFYDYYSDFRYPYATVSLTRTDELENLRDVVRNILSDVNETTLVNRDLSPVQRLEYLVPSKVGMLYDMEDLLRQLATDGQQLELARCLAATVPYKAHTPESYYAAKTAANRQVGPMPVERYCGLTMFAPQSASLSLWQWYKERVSWYDAVYR